MKCASCHNSFIDEWKLDDAYGLAAVSSETPIEIHRCDNPTGQIAKSKFVFPSLGDIDHSLPKEERLKRLAELVTLKENGRFARTIVNRLWDRMTGRGLVHPVDVMANEAWSEPLLNFLANDFVEHDYDLKRTLHLIATSKIYRSAVAQVESSENAGEYVFRGVKAKRMTAEQLVDSVWLLTGSGPANPHAAIAPVKRNKSSRRPSLAGEWIWDDTTAHQSPAGQTVYFRRAFKVEAIPDRAIVVASCDNELELWINGHQVVKSDQWHEPASADLKPHLIEGENVILAKGSNLGPGKNPAGFYAMVEFGNSQDTKTIVTDGSWQFSDRPVVVDQDMVSQDINWNAAKTIPNAWRIYGGITPKVRAAMDLPGSLNDSFVRASLVRADLLMRSLGRPNREQVVTSRPASLSTLQALDLSNGEILSGWLRTGAKTWIALQRESGWSDDELVNEVFRRALSREPSPDELELFSLGRAQNKQEAVEDMLWLIVMLPEFQLIQ